MKKGTVYNEKTFAKLVTIFLLFIIMYKIKKRIAIDFRASRGVSGTLYLQSAIAGVMFGRGLIFMEQPGVSGVDIWVFHDGNPRTMSGQE